MNRALTTLLFLIATLFAGMTLLATESWQMKRADYPKEHILPMTFAHIDHKEQQCVVCHHNYSDNTGAGLCIDCHQTTPDIAASIERHFHELCMGCHEEKQRAGEAHGPLRRCVDCHQPDDLP